MRLDRQGGKVDGEGTSGCAECERAKEALPTVPENFVAYSDVEVSLESLPYLRLNAWSEAGRSFKVSSLPCLVVITLTSLFQLHCNKEEALSSFHIRKVAPFLAGFDVEVLGNCKPLLRNPEAALHGLTSPPAHPALTQIERAAVPQPSAPATPAGRVWRG